MTLIRSIEACRCAVAEGRKPQGAACVHSHPSRTNAGLAVRGAVKSDDEGRWAEAEYPWPDFYGTLGQLPASGSRHTIPLMVTIKWLLNNFGKQTNFQLNNYTIFRNTFKPSHQGLPFLVIAELRGLPSPPSNYLLISTASSPRPWRLSVSNSRFPPFVGHPSAVVIPSEAPLSNFLIYWPNYTQPFAFGHPIPSRNPKIPLLLWWVHPPRLVE